MIEGKKVSMREISKEDTPLIVKWRNNPKVRSNFIYQELFTQESHNHWMDTKVASGEVVQYIIFDKETDMPVGSVYFRDIDKNHDKAEFGIFIGEDSARGKGLGSEVTELFCDFGFQKLNLHKIMLRVLADNAGAIRAYENAGFVQEAYLKDDVKLDGRYRDVIFMAKIRHAQEQ